MRCVRHDQRPRLDNESNGAILWWCPRGIHQRYLGHDSQEVFAAIGSCPLHLHWAMPPSFYQSTPTAPSYLAVGGINWHCMCSIPHDKTKILCIWYGGFPGTAFKNNHIQGINCQIHRHFSTSIRWRAWKTWPFSSTVNSCWFYLTRLSIQKFQPPKPIHWSQLFMGHLTLGGLGERQGPKIGSDPDHVAVTNREIWPLPTPTTPNDDWLWKVVMICDHFSLVRVVKWSCNNF